MTKKDLLIDEIAQIPEPYIDTVLDFVRFLKTKAFDDKFGTLALSEAKNLLLVLQRPQKQILRFAQNDELTKIREASEVIS